MLLEEKHFGIRCVLCIHTTTKAHGSSLRSLRGRKSSAVFEPLMRILYCSCRTMLLSAPYTNRPFIKLKPQSVLIGLRTPDNERELIISAARIAGIQEIYQVVINDDNLLGKQKISEA